MPVSCEGLGVTQDFVVLEHGGFDVRVRWPVPASFTGVGLVLVETGGVGLQDFVVLKEEESNVGRRHLIDERLSLVQPRAQPPIESAASIGKSLSNSSHSSLE